VGDEEPVDCSQVEANLRHFILSRGASAIEILRRILEVDRRFDKEGSLGWQWHDVMLSPATLQYLVRLGAVRITFKSRRYTHYRLRCRDVVERLLKEGPRPVGTLYGKGEKIDIDRLFDAIENHDDVKEVFRYALTSNDPVHVLLIGPPSSGKTLFILSLEKLPGAFFVVGYRSTKAGLAEVLLTMRPRYLLIDEIDKMEYRDINILINLMEEGRVSVHLKGQHIEERMKVWVFATANTARLPRYITSRFEPFIIHFREYTRDEFLRIAPRALSKLEGINEELARYIAERVARFTTDFRAARNLARSVKRFQNDLEEAKKRVDAIIGILRKRRPSWR